MEIVTIPKGNSVAEIEVSYKPTLKLSALTKVQHSEEVYRLLIETWDKTKLQFVEQFKVMLLNRANRVLGICTITTGSATGTIADPRLIFAVALKSNACNIILAHNHPSGNLCPSTHDCELTQKIKEGGKLLEVTVIDHLIVSIEGYYSFANDGAM
jgi:DNA repair protein RadC